MNELTDYCGSVFILSTGHLRQSTADMLDSPDPPVEVYGYKNAPGFLVYVPQSIECERITRRNFAGRDIDAKEDIPVELLYLWGIARGIGCRWIMFDADADLVEHLPSFDW